MEVHVPCAPAWKEDGVPGIDFSFGIKIYSLLVNIHKNGQCTVAENIIYYINNKF